MSHYGPDTKTYNNHGFALLINGNAGSGKTTISKTLVERLEELGVTAHHILFDKERHKFAPKSSYQYLNDSARKQTYSNAANYYKTRVEKGQNLIIDTGARDNITRGPLIEIVPNLHLIYLECPSYIMIWRETKRSIKGENREMQRGRFLYIRAYASLVLPQTFQFPQPGVTTIFEPPSTPHLVVPTHKKTIDEEVSQIIDYLSSQKLISV